jgi:predicted dehydrogenase
MGQNVTRLRTGIVGCRRGLGVARRVREMPEYEVVGVCDLDRERAEAAAATLGVAAFTDSDAMLRALKPDVLFIATNTQPRAALTIAAAEAGVPGVIAEKPMAMSLGEARSMLAACQRAGTRLIVTHQRRMGGDLLEMRSLIEEGALGDVEWVRASCAGDLLTDGTHAINSVRFLLGDPPAQWVLGQIFRPKPGPHLPPDLASFTGFRYGHPVEAGAVGLIQFAGGVRAEIFTGKAQLPGRPYQDYEEIGRAHV